MRLGSVRVELLRAIRVENQFVIGLRKLTGMSVAIEMDGDADLFEVIDARRATSRGASHLHGWNHQRDQNPDNGDDYQQLDERKATSIPNFHSATISRKRSD